MSTVAVSTALNARLIANEWLSEHLPDRFAAGIPQTDKHRAAWGVPVWLSYPHLNPLGPVGEILIDKTNEAVQSHTPLDVMRTHAQRLYEQHREQIEARIS